MFLKSFKTRLTQFRDDTRGTMTIEFVIAMPILFWAFMSMYVFFDGYRQSSVNLKAAYTISDLISRETGGINDNYIDSMVSLMQVLTRPDSPITMRISVVRWDATDDRYYVDWSANRGFDEPLTDATVLDLRDRLPVMPDLERVILVETNNTFIPPLRVMLKPVQLENFVFTRPRFAPQVSWES
jgi:hypothetical protein